MRSKTIKKPTNAPAEEASPTGPTQDATPGDGGDQVGEGRENADVDDNIPADPDFTLPAAIEALDEKLEAEAEAEEEAEEKHEHAKGHPGRKATVRGKAGAGKVKEGQRAGTHDGKGKATGEVKETKKRGRGTQSRQSDEDVKSEEEAGDEKVAKKRPTRQSSVTSTPSNPSTIPGHGHAQHHKHAWSDSETAYIKQLVLEHGHAWQTVAKKFNERFGITGETIRGHWRGLERRGEV